jgi:hypothetical protein
VIKNERKLFCEVLGRAGSGREKWLVCVRGKRGRVTRSRIAACLVSPAPQARRYDDDDELSSCPMGLEWFQLLSQHTIFWGAIMIGTLGEGENLRLNFKVAHTWAAPAYLHQMARADAAKFKTTIDKHQHCRLSWPNVLVLSPYIRAYIRASCMRACISRRFDQRSERTTTVDWEHRHQVLDEARSLDNNRADLFNIAQTSTTTTNAASMTHQLI